MAILETWSLTRRFGELVAVDSFTVAVQPGEVFALVGPNGAGKTTVIKMLVTLLPPSSGTARVAGYDIVRQAAQVRRVIGYVPQALSADATLTGYENLLIFAAIFYGIAIIWERDLGITYKFLASPTPREALVLGKALSAGLRALVQAVIIYALAALLGVALDLHPLNLLGVIAAILLGATVFSTFSLIIASLVKTREAFMGISQVLIFPLFFASNAIYPTALMPGWLQVIARLNPLSYQVDALRALMLAGGASAFGLGVDFAVLLAVSVVLVIVGARLYPRVAV